MNKSMKTLLSLALCLLLLSAAPLALAGEEAGVPSRGFWKENLYVNDYAKLSFDMPENWYKYSDADLAALMGVSADLISEAGVPFSQELMDQNMIYDVLVADLSTGSNFSIAFENLGATGTLVTPDIYFSALKSQLAQVMPSMEMGDPADAAIAGVDYRMMEAEDASSGMYQRYYMRKQGNYMIEVILTVMSGGSAQADEIMALFK